MPGRLRVVGEMRAFASLPHPSHQFVVEGRHITVQINLMILDPSRSVTQVFLLGVFEL
jgi:hypothetical protein